MYAISPTINPRSRMCVWIFDTAHPVVIVPHPVKLMQLKRLMQPSKADTAKEADTAIQAHTAGLHPFTVVSTRVDV